MDYSGIILIFTALLLGFQHGYDLDHLSIIDSITRTVSSNRQLSRSVGILFSLGHGLIVTIISLTIGSGMMRSQVPFWLDNFGNWVSIFFLFTLGIISLWNILHKPTTTSTISLKFFLIRKMLPKKINGLTIILVGALFAFSFDTFSQIALFSISASLLSGWVFSGVMGMVFMLGMMISDGLNGLLVSSLILRADEKSHLISRITGLSIAFFSLTVGMLNLAKLI